MVKATPLADATNTIHGRQLKKGKRAVVPTVKEITAIKDSIYASCEKKRKMLSWAKCPKYTLDPLVDRAMKMMKPKAGEHFVDVGSGTGNIIAHVATRFAMNCTGIELVKCNLDVAREAEDKFRAYRDESNLPQPTITYLEGDLRIRLPEVTADTDILWCSNFLFPLEVNAFILGQLYRLKPGARAFLFRDLVPDKQNVGSTKYFEKTNFHWGPGEVEWTNEPGDLVIYVRTDIPYER
eukprot:TRINITY_DN4653_c4_g1_i1.p1 TRINITY_DN4653_c4_g1~~TRINITY_DN4653_c4_g1_i1.p1  ORF type:complete len:252 (+),score=32.77 TRINITY_DN4653_c4_g1_i1:44-757(+)